MNYISNRQLVIRLVSIILIFSLIVGVGVGLFLKQEALKNLAKEDAKKTSELIFEALYTKMQEGWGEDDLNKILQRLNRFREGLIVSSYRSESVEEIMGVIQSEREVIESDKLIQKAMQGVEKLIVNRDGSIRYLYPMRAKSECLTCHYNSKVGDVNGVIDIKYPSSDIKISLDTMIFYFILSFILIILVIFFIFYLILERKLIQPISKFTKNMIEIIDSKEFNKEMEIDSQIIEIRSIEIYFNKLLKSINYYYNQVIDNFYIDSLTSLPNILKLNRDLSTLDDRALVLIDIDSFKSINSFYGFRVGDSILIKLAKELQECCHPEYRLYRVSADEFALLIDRESLDESFLLRVRKYIQKIKFKYRDIDIQISITLGVTDSKDTTLERATLALNEAKRKREAVVFYSEELKLDRVHQEHIFWTKCLKDAIEERRILLYYQPIFDISKSKVTKYESLVRLIDKSGKIYSPFFFLEVAKKSKLYGNLTKIIIDESFKRFQERDEEFSVNISMDDILNSEIRDYIFLKLRNYKTPERVIFEIVESEEIEEFELINQFIQDIKSFGSKVAVDDFGSGYSNFSYILELNIDILKIDSSLVKNIATDENSYNIVKTIVDFSKKLNIKTVAEYVESKEISDIVTEIGVDYLQGYYIGKPSEDLI